MSKWKAPKDDIRFHTTEYVVDASHEASHQIWYRWHMLYGVEFDQDGLGYYKQIGTIDGRPICVTVFWHIIDKLFRVAFVDGTSQLVDYKMIDDWQRSVFRCRQIEAAYRHSDATNFGNIIGDIQRRSGKTLVKGDTHTIEAMIRNYQKSLTPGSMVK